MKRTHGLWFTLRTDLQLNVYWGLWSVGQPLCHSVTPPPTGGDNPNPGVYPPEDTGEVEKQRISPVALQRISCSRVGSLSSVALFCCIFSFGTFFGIIRVYTVVFSDPEYHVRPGESDSGWQTSSGSLIQCALASLMSNSDELRCVSRFWW